jgi:hypothetical protein
MTAPSPSEEFLRIERAADQLLDELTSLRVETLSYQEAHATLGAAAANVGALAGSLGETVACVGDAVRALREIGTPQLLAQQAQHESQLDGVLRLMEAQHAQLREIESRVAAAAATAAATATRRVAAVAVGMALLLVLVAHAIHLL